MNPDPLGHTALERRLAQIPGELAGMLVRGLPELKPATLASRRFIVTGTGSSEAHARYFCTLINLFTDRSATAIPLSAFLNPANQHLRDKTLVVFSQGLSPNAQIALRRHRDFHHTVVFTSATPASARAAGKGDRADLLSDLAEAGADIIHFPLSEEYTTLIRFVGPACGYLACLQFAASLPGCAIDRPRPGQVLPLFELEPPDDLLEAVLAHPGRFARGFNLVSAAPISDFAQNLACKFMEGLFWSCPTLSDFLQFAHGPFQQATADRHPVVLLQGDLRAEADLVRRSRDMLRGVGLDAYVVQVPASMLFSIFGFEHLFNRVVYRAMVHFGVDQVNWPGKGRDDFLYGFCRDESGAV